MSDGYGSSVCVFVWVSTLSQWVRGWSADSRARAVEPCREEKLAVGIGFHLGHGILNMYNVMKQDRLRVCMCVCVCVCVQIMTMPKQTSLRKIGHGALADYKRCEWWVGGGDDDDAAANATPATHYH